MNRLSFRSQFLLVVLASLVDGVALAGGPVQALRFGRVLDGRGHSIPDATVILEGERIHSIGGAATPIPPGATVIDLSRYTAIPGLIDVHTHLTYYCDPSDPAPYSQQKDMPAAMAVFLSQVNTRRTLEVGVTTVRDLGSMADYQDISMRELIKRGAMLGPRMLVAGFGLIASSDPIMVTMPHLGGRADGVPQVMRVIRQQFAAGVDVIKMYASAGSQDNLNGAQTFSFEEIDAAVKLAHQLGKKIAIHTYGAAGARDAVRAGADSIEHPVDLDDATLAEMARRRIFYVPTIDHNRYYSENAVRMGYSQTAADELRAFMKRNLETLRRALRAGVPIAMGSDATCTMYGENTRELGWFVRAGMTPAQALATATTNAAQLLGMEKSLGALAPGYLADIVAVSGDPLADIDVVIHKVRWVMQAGKVVINQTACDTDGSCPPAAPRVN
jgi:imidazolonepropionase-like amidohydrolase